MKMKKLLVLAAAAAMVMGAKAVTVSWSSGNLYFNGAGSAVAGPGTAVADGSVTGYLFTFSDKTAYDGYTTAAQLWAASSLVETDSSTLTGADYCWDVWKSESGSIAFYQNQKYNPGDVVYAAVILSYDKDMDGKADFYSANTFEGAVGDDGVNFANVAHAWGDQNTGDGTTWSAIGAVPEPTSGLLLLLGVAGLALKRKRA